MCVVPKLRYSLKCSAHLQSLVWRRHFGVPPVVHQYGGEKILLASWTFFGCLGHWLSPLHFSAYCNVLNGWKSLDKYILFDKRDRNFKSRTAITHHDSKCAGFKTDINIPPVHAYRVLKLWWRFSFGFKNLMTSHSIKAVIIAQRNFLNITL